MLHFPGKQGYLFGQHRLHHCHRLHPLRVTGTYLLISALKTVFGCQFHVVGITFVALDSCFLLETMLVVISIATGLRFDFSPSQAFIDHNQKLRTTRNHSMFSLEIQ